MCYDISKGSVIVWMFMMIYCWVVDWVRVFQVSCDCDQWIGIWDYVVEYDLVVENVEVCIESERVKEVMM